MIRLRAAAMVMAIAIATGLLSGCSAYYVGEGSPKLTTARVEGSWSQPGPNGTAATLTLASDGTFTATNIPLIAAPPNGTDELHVYWNDAKSGAGTWSIRPDYHDPPVIDLQFDAQSMLTFEGDPADEYAGDYSSLLSIEQNKRDGLFLTAGDPDEKYRLIFHRAGD